MGRKQAESGWANGWIDRMEDGGVRERERKKDLEGVRREPDRIPQLFPRILLKSVKYK